MMFRIAAGALLLALAAPASAMTAAEFLTRAETLMKKSKVTLLFSRDARSLMGEAAAAADRTRARLAADRAAGRPVTTCLPPKGKARISASELVAYLRDLPAAQKSQSFDAAFAGYAAKKYPCRS